jgi:MarR family transcriptional regulator, organic hydroperoxide resistance regulator
VLQIICRHIISAVRIICQQNFLEINMLSDSIRIADIVDNLRRIFQVVHGQYKKAERVLGLTGPQIWAIKIIADAAPIKVSDIAARMYLHPATVGGILDRLEMRNLVLRTRSVEDRRVVHVDLTKKGRDLIRKSPEITQLLMVNSLEKLSPAKLQSVATGLEVLVDILGAQPAAAKSPQSTGVNVPAAKEKLKGMAHTALSSEHSKTKGE